MAVVVLMLTWPICAPESHPGTEHGHRTCRRCGANRQAAPSAPLVIS